MHLNGSARVQSVALEDDERLHRTVEGFAKRSGVPMLCNTSLNDRGEPIVASAADAINFCRRKGLAVLYIEGFRVELDPAAPGVPFGPRVRNAALLDDAQQYRRRAWQEWRGSGVSDEALFLMNRFPELRPLVHSETGQARLRQTVNEVAGQDRFAAQFETFMAEFDPIEQEAHDALSDVRWPGSGRRRLVQRLELPFQQDAPDDLAPV